MTIIEAFPSDDVYRVVKWIDKFTLPHLTTRSASVNIRLQRIALSSHVGLNALTTESAAALLPMDFSSGGQNDYVSIPVHAGLLPHFTIGRVYRGRQLVGELPTRRHILSLPQAEQSCREIRIDQELEAPAGWTRSYKQLLASEFGGIQSEFAASRCLVVTERGIDYVIPRTVIFQSFYAIQRELAYAFTAGPWPVTKHRVVHNGELSSGLRTQIDPETGAWHVILERHIEDDFAKLAALLYFDEYASACAASIYAGMLADRRGGTYPWFASARLPFRAEAKPLKLEVKGLLLPPRRGKPGADGKRLTLKQSFLVTSILASSWPSYTPDIAYGRVNSGDKGEEQLPAEGDRPYAGHLRPQPASDLLVTTSAIDASANFGDVVTLENTFSWLDGPEPTKLTKQSSQRYGGPKATPHSTRLPELASGGDRTHQEGGAAPAHHKVLVRDPVNRFHYLIEAFDSLRATGELTNHTVYQPATRSQLAHCGGLICWNFLDETSRQSGKWPGAGWRMFERARWMGAEKSLGKPRCALVVRIETPAWQGYWLEVETRHSEGGVLSPVFAVSPKANAQGAVAHLIESIARADGRGLRDVVRTAMGELGAGIAYCYKHQYEGETNSALDIDSIRRFLRKIEMASTPSLP